MDQRESAEAETQSEDCKARPARGQGRSDRKLPLGINSVVGDPSLPLPSPLEPMKYPPPPAAADIAPRSKALAEWGGGGEGEGRGRGGTLGETREESCLKDGLPAPCTSKH